MKTKFAATLSGHVLEEASKFAMATYPKRIYRNALNREVQGHVENTVRELLEWRKTFSPNAAPRIPAKFDEPVVLDDIYSREVLRRVPGMMERTRA